MILEYFTLQAEIGNNIRETETEIIIIIGNSHSPLIISRARVLWDFSKDPDNTMSKLSFC